MSSPLGTYSSYHLSLPVLSPPISRNAVLRGSKAYKTLYGRPSCCIRSSRIWLWREDSTPEEWGIFSVGPASESSVTEKSTLTCSAASSPSHHSLNSSENSTSHAILY